MLKLNPQQMEKFVLAELSKAGISHNVFTQEAVSLIVRTADGVLTGGMNRT